MYLGELLQYYQSSPQGLAVPNLRTPSQKGPCTAHIYKYIDKQDYEEPDVKKLFNKFC